MIGVRPSSFAALTSAPFAIKYRAFQTDHALLPNRVPFLYYHDDLYRLYGLVEAGPHQCAHSLQHWVALIYFDLNQDALLILITSVQYHFPSLSSDS